MLLLLVLRTASIRIVFLDLTLPNTASMLLLLDLRTASIRIVFRSNLAEDGLDAPGVGLQDGLD
jgi:hypothetical protein